MSTSSSVTETVAPMDTYKNGHEFGYMPHYQHYAAVLEAGGLKLSSPEQRYLIDVIRRETRTPAARPTSGRRSTKYKPVVTKREGVAQYCSLRITSQEEDLLRSLLGDRDESAGPSSSPSYPSPASSGSSQGIPVERNQEVQKSHPSGHAAIFIPFSDDDEDVKPWIKKDDDENEERSRL
ncbi:hypothetical protein PRZ48_004121 [Zasmidium cellare]|uniref:Uncharacterized protein n=1 Tax=Zasmidium cellare TaxID=395010 RepID=A0ABR0EYB5_ZASCE|nr:hypothetical protein PRZ48_004121 [Zasmidium cellare]